ncbi:hypothetical protein [Streptomyces sp. KL116D]|uniref:hypothetical protein n=1 Tax=Streptomyces sp. KL116D TaxID=3045152 RepID=UPI0035587FB3
MPPRSTWRCSLAAGLLLTGCSDSTHHARATLATRPSTPRPQPCTGRTSSSPNGHTGPGLRTPFSRIPAATRQAIVVTGDGADATTGTAQRYVRDATTGWQRLGTPWPTRNALKGWTAHHVQGDLRTLRRLRSHGRGRPRTEPRNGARRTTRARPSSRTAPTPEGEPLGDAFDYVVAINYNRKPGTTPLDWTRPLGMNRGGGIWFHVDHGGPTQGCVTLPAADARTAALAGQGEPTGGRDGGTRRPSDAEPRRALSALPSRSQFTSPAAASPKRRIMAYMLNYNLAVPDVDDAGVLAALVAEGDGLDVLSHGS